VENASFIQNDRKQVCKKRATFRVNFYEEKPEKIKIFPFIFILKRQ